MTQGATGGYKIAQSVLVLIHTPALDVLLIQRADTPADRPEYWQSVTGAKDHVDEPYAVTAWREVHEETGIDARRLPQGLVDWGLENVYEIYPWWRKRYAPGVTHNTEHLFSLCVPAGTPIRLAPREHRAYQWLPWREAAEVCASPSNAEACLLLPRFAGPVVGIVPKS
jgi:dATP pyrophosphohydrolase